MSQAGDRHRSVHRKAPYAAFGNSTGDREMLEWTGAGDGVRLKMLVSHDDPAREYAYGPARGLPATKVGTFPHSMMDEAKTQEIDNGRLEERLETHLCP